MSRSPPPTTASGPKRNANGWKQPSQEQAETARTCPTGRDRPTECRSWIASGRKSRARPRRTMEALARNRIEARSEELNAAWPSGDDAFLDPRSGCWPSSGAAKRLGIEGAGRSERMPSWRTAQPSPQLEQRAADDRQPRVQACWTKTARRCWPRAQRCLPGRDRGHPQSHRPTARERSRRKRRPGRQATEQRLGRQHGRGPAALTQQAARAAQDHGRAARRWAGRWPAWPSGRSCR